MAPSIDIENRAAARAVSFGRYLKIIREKQGISLETVAKAICVPARQLSWIEAEDHERMPGEVYTKGMLRAYARQVGVDPDDIVERYKLHRQAHNEALQKESEILAAGQKAFPRSMAALAVLCVVMALSLYAYTRMDSGMPGDLSSGRHTSPGASENHVEEKLPEAVQDAGQFRQMSTRHKEAGEGLQMLSIDVVAEVTLSIQIDDQPYTKYRLDPNDHVELAARRRFHLLISDAAGVRLRFNDRPVNLHAEPGRSMDITLPRANGQR